MRQSLEPIRDALAPRYRVLQELGHGAMATVFLAERGTDGSQVAVKVLRRELVAALGPDRFHREVEILGRLRHPRIVQVLDWGAAAPYLYLVMPYVAGENLRSRLERGGQLPVAEALAIAADVAEALDYAHRENVVHRDIKPENLLLREGRALVCDFGLARAIDRAALDPVSSSGLVIGTAEYMSPEQAMAKAEIGVPCDIYALGCVVFEMLTGELPFPGPTRQAIIARHLTQPPRSIRTVRPELPEHIERAVAAALAKSPRDRPASGAELLRRLSP